jgi:hypothetical protein
VLSRLAPAPPLEFFSATEAQTATALFDLLLHLGDDSPVPVTSMVDARLAADRTDGWRYEDMPEDAQAWRATLDHLDTDALERHGRGFAGCTVDQRRAVLEAIRRRGPVGWHGLDASHVWSLWTRYACAAFYSHPAAWSEMGFPGPAFPMGYANLGIDARDHHEVPDARPKADPART